MRCAVILFGLLTLTAATVSAADKIYTIQVGSFQEKEKDAWVKKAQELEKKGLSFVRIERIGGVYALRVGKYARSADGEKDFQMVNRLFPASFLRDAYYLNERIVYPAAGTTPQPAAQSPTPVVPSPEAASGETRPVPAAVQPSEMPPSRHFWAQPIILAVIIFLLLGLVPLLPGMRELLRPKDGKPLFIKMDYSKNPRYFDQSFRELLEAGLRTAGYEPGLKKVKLSKEELVEVSDSKTVRASETVNNILYVKGDLEAGAHAHFHKEIFVGGRARLGQDDSLRAIACVGDLTFADGTRLVRWGGSEGTIKVGKNCNLGILCSCNGALEIGGGCRFRSLFGKPVMVRGGEAAAGKNESVRAVNNIEDVAWYVTSTQCSIPPDTTVAKDFIIKVNLYTVRRGCTITGDIKAYGDLVLEEGVTINGNIVAEGDVRVGPGCVITGDIFTQSRCFIGKGVRIGDERTVKSLVAKKDLELADGVIVYGYILTEGTGRVL